MNKKLVILAAASLSIVGCGQKKDWTNFILVNLDDSGYGDFSVNGAIGYTTPNIDRLASQGLRFTHFLAAQPVSGASRAGLMTGCYSNRVGLQGAPMPWMNTGISDEEMTMAQILKQKGYATGIVGKWHLGSYYDFLPLQKGFDEFFGTPYSNDMGLHHPMNGMVYGGDTIKFPPLPVYDGNEVVVQEPSMDSLTTWYTRRAVDFVHRHKDGPFLLYVAHNMPHVPLGVSEKFKGKSRQGLYGDVMEEIDWSVGEIFKAVKDEGLEDNTLIILTSDNGPWLNYGNHAGSAGGLRGGKNTTFEGGNRVQCIMYWKGVTKPGSICNKLASNIDLLPTFAEIADAPLPANKIDGVSILPLIKGDDDAEPRKSFAFYYQTYFGAGGISDGLEAVTDGQYKLIFPHKYHDYGIYLPANDGSEGPIGVSEVDSLELYDLRRDPGERYNVIAQHPDEAKKLMEIADDYRRDLGDGFLGMKGSGVREPGHSTKPGYQTDYLPGRMRKLLGF